MWILRTGHRGPARENLPHPARARPHARPRHRRRLHRRRRPGVAGPLPAHRAARRRARGPRPREHQRHLRERRAVERRGLPPATGSDRAVELVALRKDGCVSPGLSRSAATSDLQILQHERVRGALAADRVSGPWPGWTIGRVAQREQHLGDRPHQHVVVAARQIGSDQSSRRTACRRRTGARRCTCPSGRLCRQTPPGQWPGVWWTRDLVVADPNANDGRRCVGDYERRTSRRSTAGGGCRLEAEHRALLDGAVVEEQVVPMQVDGTSNASFAARDAGDVIDWACVSRMRLHLDVRSRTAARERVVNLVAGIDEDRLVASARSRRRSRSCRNGALPDLEDHR